MIAHAGYMIVGAVLGALLWSLILVNRSSRARTANAKRAQEGAQQIVGAWLYTGDAQHRTSDHVIVETHEGKVVGVWFRNLLVRFRAIPVDHNRAGLMRVANTRRAQALAGVVLRDEPPRASGKNQTTPPPPCDEGGHPFDTPNFGVSGLRIVHQATTPLPRPDAPDAPEAPQVSRGDSWRGPKGA